MGTQSAPPTRAGPPHCLRPPRSPARTRAQAGLALYDARSVHKTPHPHGRAVIAAVRRGSGTASGTRQVLRVAFPSPCARYASTTPSPQTERRLDPRDPPKVGVYACGPTVYGRVHVGNARPYVVFSLLKRFLEHEGYDATFVANITDVNDKIYDAARERGVPSADLAREMTEAYVADTELLGLGPAGQRAEGERDDRGDRGADRGPDRRRPRLRGGRRRLLPRRELRRLREALQPPARRDAAGRGRRLGRAQARAAGLRALEDAQGGRGHLVGVALGRRPAGLAHRVLGDGRGDPRRGLRDPRRRLRPDLPPPRERDRADRGRPRRAAGAPLDAQRHGRDGRREDGQVASATSACCTARSSSSAARRS